MLISEITIFPHRVQRFQHFQIAMIKTRVKNEDENSKYRKAADKKTDLPLKIAKKRENRWASQNLSKISENKKNMLKLLHILANTETVDGNQSPLHNKLWMANENNLFLVLSSKKNGGDLLCSQTPSLCFENELNVKFSVIKCNVRSIGGFFNQLSIFSKNIAIFS
jgi:hypothetical protein